MTASRDAAFVSVGAFARQPPGRHAEVVRNSSRAAPLISKRWSPRRSRLPTTDWSRPTRRWGLRGRSSSRTSDDCPEPTDGGKTTRHTSSGNPLFRRTNRRRRGQSPRGRARGRVLRAGRLLRSDWRSISVRRRGCNLSRGIVTNHAARTITFHLTAPDPDFLTKLALLYAYAVPASTPSGDLRNHPVPATGPYMIFDYVPGKLLRLVRNPRSAPGRRQHSRTECQRVNGGSTSDRTRRYGGESGRADFAFDGVPLKRFAGLDAVPNQLAENPEPRTTYVFLNAQRVAVQRRADPSRRQSTKSTGSSRASARWARPRSTRCQLLHRTSPAIGRTASFNTANHLGSASGQPPPEEGAARRVSASGQRVDCNRLGRA